MAFWSSEKTTPRPWSFKDLFPSPTSSGVGSRRTPSSGSGSTRRVAGPRIGSSKLRAVLATYPTCSETRAEATELTQRMESGVPQADGAIAAEPTMDVVNVANAVRNMASLPLDANVPFLTVMATKMPFVGRG